MLYPRMSKVGVEIHLDGLCKYVSSIFMRDKVLYFVEAQNYCSADRLGRSPVTISFDISV